MPTTRFPNAVNPKLYAENFTANGLGDRSTEDAPPKVIEQLELLLARYSEIEEARVEQLIRDAGLEKYIHFNTDDE